MCGNVRNAQPSRQATCAWRARRFWRKPPERLTFHFQTLLRPIRTQSLKHAHRTKRHDTCPIVRRGTASCSPARQTFYFFCYRHNSFACLNWHSAHFHWTRQNEAARIRMVLQEMWRQLSAWLTTAIRLTAKIRHLRADFILGNWQILSFNTCRETFCLWNECAYSEWPASCATDIADCSYRESKYATSPGFHTN